MGIPRRIKKGNSLYEFEKKYPSFYMYKEVTTGVRICFDRFDLLGLGKLPQHEKRNKWERG